DELHVVGRPSRRRRRDRCGVLGRLQEADRRSPEHVDLNAAEDGPRTAAVTQDGPNEEASRRQRTLLLAGAALAGGGIGAVLVIADDVGGVRTRAVNQVTSAYGDAVYKNMHDHCISSANDTIRRSGADPDAADVHGRITGYCDCVVAEVRAQFTLSE